MHPHRHCHVNPPNSNGQELHQDGTPRQFSGWNHPWRRHHHLRLAMAFYYPHDVSETMGELVLFRLASTTTIVIQKMIE